MRPASLIRAALAVVYALFILPAGLIMRLLGIDPMRMRPDTRHTSEWEEQ